MLLLMHGMCTDTTWHSVSHVHLVEARGRWTAFSWSAAYEAWGLLRGAQQLFLFSAGFLRFKTCALGIEGVFPSKSADMESKYPFVSIQPQIMIWTCVHWQTCKAFGWPMWRSYHGSVWKAIAYDARLWQISSALDFGPICRRRSLPWWRLIDWTMDQRTIVQIDLQARNLQLMSLRQLGK